MSSLILNHKSLNIEIIKKYYLYFLIFYTMCLSYTAIFDIQTRYLVYSFSLLIIFKIKKFFINNKVISFIFCFLILHQFYHQPSLFSQMALLVGICLFILIHQNLNFFKKNLIKTFYYTFYFVNFYIVLNLIFNQNLTDQLFYVDKIGRNFIELMIVRCGALTFNTSNLIFLETSHMAMVLPTLFGAFLLYEKNLILKIILLLIYSFVSIIAFSNTMFFSNLILIVVFFLIFQSENKFFYEKLIILIPTIFLVIFIFLNPDKCLQKINELNYNIKKHNPNTLVSKDNVSKEKNLKNDTFNGGVNRTIGDLMNPSSFAYKFHLLLVFENLKKNLFGVGFNNYEKNYKILKEMNIKKDFKSFIYLNYNDGASNGLKLLGEFGLLVVIPIIFFIKFSISSNVDKKIKLVCLVLVLSQVIRGTGYFNGGFILVGILIICLSLESKKKFKKVF